MFSTCACVRDLELMGSRTRSKVLRDGPRALPERQPREPPSAISMTRSQSPSRDSVWRLLESYYYYYYYIIEPRNAWVSHVCNKASREMVIQDLRALKEMDWEMIVPDGVEDKLILDHD